MVKTVATSHMWLLGTLSVASVIKTLGFFVFSSSFFYFLFYLGLLLQHIEIPRLGDLIRATAAGLCHSHSNARSELHL